MQNAFKDLRKCMPQLMHTDLEDGQEPERCLSQAKLVLSLAPLLNLCAQVHHAGSRPDFWQRACQGMTKTCLDSPDWSRLRRLVKEMPVSAISMNGVRSWQRAQLTPSNSTVRRLARSSCAVHICQSAFSFDRVL